jgi:glycosyltransferase involved in cell wall biosynthesis
VARPLQVLFAPLSLPHPPTNGHRLRMWALLRGLVEEGHRVTLVSFADAQDTEADLGPLRTLCAAVDIVPAPAANGHATVEALRRLVALASILPYGAWKFRSVAFAAAIDRHLAERKFDLLLCGGVYNAPNLSHQHLVPILLDKDDMNYVIYERWLRFETSLLRRSYGLIERSKMKRWEFKVCRRMVGLLVASEIERRILNTFCPQVPTFVIPNVVDTNHYTPQPANGTKYPIVLYQGGMDWHPNRDAVDFFVSAILPELRRLVPSVVFRVAGRSPSESFRRRFSSIARMEFSGTVHDMRDEIARATVCVVPLRIGSGTRLKILEAAAMSKPIISTRVGTEGLDFRAGEEILLADDPALFAQTTASLLSDPFRCRTLGIAARRRVEEQYSPTALRQALRTALWSVVPSSRDASQAIDTRRSRSGVRP